MNCIRTDDEDDEALGADPFMLSNEDVAAGWGLGNGHASMDVSPMPSVSGPPSVPVGPSCSAVPVLLANAQPVSRKGVRLDELSACEAAVSAAVLLAISTAANAPSESAEVLIGVAAGIALDAPGFERALLAAENSAYTSMVALSHSARGVWLCLDVAEAGLGSISDASSILTCVSAASAAASAATSAKLLRRCAEAHLEDCVRAEADVVSLCARIKICFEAAQVANGLARRVSSEAHTVASEKLQMWRQTFDLCLPSASKAAGYLEYCTRNVATAVSQARLVSKCAADTVVQCDRVRAMHTDGGNARPGTPQWYKQRFRDKLFPGSKITLQQAVYGLLMWKRVYSVGRKAMDTLIKLISTRMLPQGHILPPSLHILQRVSEAQEWDEYEVHVCGKKSCAGHAWDYIPRGNWKEHCNDVCPHCSGPRFKSSKVTGTIFWGNAIVRLITYVYFLLILTNTCHLFC